MGYKIDTEKPLLAVTGDVTTENGITVDKWSAHKINGLIIKKGEVIVIEKGGDKFSYHPTQVYAHYVPTREFVEEKRATEGGGEEGKIHRVAPFQVNLNKN